MAIDREQEILRLVREGAKPRAALHERPSIVIRGDRNIVGDLITIAQPQIGRRVTRRAARAQRSAAIAFIRSAAHSKGMAVYSAFANYEFGTDSLDDLTDLQLERVRGWCAAKLYP